MDDVLAWLDDREARRRSEGLRRELRPRSVGDTVIDLASNDYLGLATHPEVIAAAGRALQTWGAGATGSRLVTGTTGEHAALEEELADFTGFETALVFSSGYAANLGIIPALVGRGDLVVSDAGSHASLVDACRLSRARVAVTPRAEVGAVEEALARRAEERAVVVTDSVYSADGDLAPLRELHDVCRAHGAVLVVDEAHALGVRGEGGRGLVHECGLAGEPDVVATATLSKSLGSQGGVVLGSRRVRDHLVDAARTFIFDTGLAPAAVGAARGALAVLRREPGLAGAVLARAGELAEISGVPKPPSAVVSVILGDPDVAVAARDACLERGVHVGCFRPPSVPEGTSRLRLTARASLSGPELARVREVLAEVLAGARR